MAHPGAIDFLHPQFPQRRLDVQLVVAAMPVQRNGPVRLEELGLFEPAFHQIRDRHGRGRDVPAKAPPLVEVDQPFDHLFPRVLRDLMPAPVRIVDPPGPPPARSLPDRAGDREVVALPAWHPTLP